MADRYWVGGTGIWNSSNTTNWSTSSGGSGGASVPTSSDNVFFDSNSGTGTCTWSGLVNCLDFNVSASNISFSGFLTQVFGSINISAPSLSVSGFIYQVVTTSATTNIVPSLPNANLLMSASSPGSITINSNISAQKISFVPFQGSGTVITASNRTFTGTGGASSGIEFSKTVSDTAKASFTNCSFTASGGGPVRDLSSETSNEVFTFSGCSFSGTGIELRGGSKTSGGCTATSTNYTSINTRSGSSFSTVSISTNPSHINSFSNCTITTVSSATGSVEGPLTLGGGATITSLPPVKNSLKINGTNSASVSLVGTSSPQIVNSDSTGYVTSASKTNGNLQFSSGNLQFGTFTFSGDNTLTLSGGSVTATTLSINGSTTPGGAIVTGDTSAKTINANSYTLSNITWTNITAAGTIPFKGTGFVDGGGNTNIQFYVPGSGLFFGSNF